VLRLIWLHILALWSIAVAQPLLGLLGTSPEFFVAHRAGAAEILILTLVLVVLLPSAVAAGVALISLAGSRALVAGVGLVVAGLTGLVAMQVLVRAGVSSWMVAVPIATAAGAGAAVAYHALAPVRGFLAALSIAALLVPAAFLARPGIRSLVLDPLRDVPALAAAITRSASSDTPVVLVILDELPLVSLLDRSEQIDPALYPNFAALARDAIWFRNTTTVNDFTPWAVPSILTGQYPRHSAVPTAADHPDSLFTVLSRTHRLEVRESLTRLCPEALCASSAGEGSLGQRLRAIAIDLRVVFLHAILTDDLTADLPEPTETWAGFGAGQPDAGTPIETAVAARNEPSRMGPVREFLEGISREDTQPSFYYLHTLISHHPYYMLPGNRENKTWVQVPGKAEKGWDEKQPWAVTQQYQKQLLQTGFVDGLIGQLVRRLRDADLYDRTLIVITADHGVSHVPDTPERNLVDRSAAEILRVPLIVKLPQRFGIAGQVSDVSAQTIDILPTIVDVLDLEAPSGTDGTSLLDPERPARTPRAFFSGATGRRSEVASDGPSVGPAISRKLALFGEGRENLHHAPRLPPYDALVGRSIGDLRVTDGGGRVELTHAWAFEDVDPAASAVVFDVGGRFASPHPATVLAVAINGVVEAVTRTWEANPHGWLATPRFDVWRPGRNAVEVFVVDRDGTGLVLRRTTFAGVRPADLNLITDAAVEWGVHQGGFHPTEQTPDGREFRWTRDVSELSNLLTHEPPREVQVDVLMLPAGPAKILKIEANDCTLFDGEVRNGWSETLPLDRCAIGPEGLVLRFSTDAPRAPDRRRLGVALSRVVVR
jgi:hypothetical protein